MGCPDADLARARSGRLWHRDVVRLMLLAALLVAACSTAPDAPGSPVGSGAGGGAAREAWRTATLRDVLTGDDFSIADLVGKVVVIEPMAIWCVNCRFQQLEAQHALETLGADDVVYLSLDVDARERPEDLAAYTRREGFDWRFAIASTEVSRSLAATFGDQVLSPPATPLIVLSAAGEVVDRHFGGKNAAELVALLRPLLP